MNKIAFAIAACSLSTVARAGAPTDPSTDVHDAKPVAESDDTSFSLTVSPLHALLPALELTGEVKVAPDLGVAIIGGIGTAPFTDEGTTLTFDAGLQGRWYVTGDFHEGVDLALEVTYTGVDFPERQGTVVDDSAYAGILAGGPLVGYKYTTDFGLTLDAQVGVQVALLTTDSVAGKTDQDVVILPNANLNVGWSW